MESPIQFSEDFFRIFMDRLRADGGSITFNPAEAPSHKAPEPPNPPLPNPPPLNPPPPNPILSEPPVSEPPISDPHPGPPSTSVDSSVDNPDDLSLKGRYAQMVKNPPNIGAPHVAPRLAPEPVLNPAHGQGFRKKLQQMVLEETLDSELQEILQIIAIAADEQNPFARKARDTMANIYQDVVAQMAPSIPVNDHWCAETVSAYAEAAFLARIRLSRGPTGDMVQSRTARNWLWHLSYIICQYTRNCATGEHAGLTVLRKDGLLDKLENRLRWAVREYNMPTHIEKQVHLDRAALQLIMEGTIDHTTEYGRHGAIQTLLGITLCYYGMFRSGSLQANIKTFRDEKKYLKIGDCTINIVQPACWSLVVDVRHWKGHSGIMGRSAVMTFGPVSKAHNLNFEAPLYFVMDLLARGALEGIETLDELFEFKGAVLPIKSEFLNYPVLLKRGARGFTVEEGEPMGPHKLTAHIHKRGLDVGIAGASVHAIRRASADKFAVSMGKDKTLFVLNHGDRLGKTFDEHYSTGLQHIPLVDIMLDEYAGKLSPLELKTLRNKALASPAVNALVRRSKMSEEGVTTARSRYRQTKEEIEQIQNHPRYARLTEECTVAWNQVIDLYPSVSSPYSTQSGKALPRIMKNPTTYPEAVVQARVNHFKALNAQSGKLRRKLLSKLRYQTAMEVAKESWKGVTAEERDKAAEDLEKSNPVLDEIANAHQQEVSNYLRSKRQPTALRVSKVDAMSMELPEEIRQELEGAPDSAEEESDEESDDNPEEDDDNITLAAGLPINPPAITPTVPAPAPNRISQLNISLDRPPAIAPDIPDVEDQLDNEPPFDDSKEPDALGLPVDVARKLYMRLLYRPLLLQRERALDKGKGKSQFICRECLRFPTRVKDPKIVEAGGMVFKTSSALGRHMQEQHDAWSNLELEMVSGKPGMLKCPECPFEVTSKITMFRHLRTSCPSKDKFIPLYEARQSFRPSEQMNEAARQDRRREAKLVSTTILPEDDTIEIAEDVKKRLAQPGMLKRWAEQVGYNQSKFGEHTAEEIQAHLHTLFDAAIQHASGSGPEPVEALPQNCMDRTLEDTIKLVTEGPYAEDLEDYDDGDADDGNNAGLGD